MGEGSQKPLPAQRWLCSLHGWRAPWGTPCTPAHVSNRPQQANLWSVYTAESGGPAVKQKLEYQIMQRTLGRGSGVEGKPGDGGVARTKMRGL